MNTLFSIEFWSAYMLPSATSLAVFYLLYKGLVRNDTHLNTRRFTILGILVFSMLLPFLNFQMPMNVVNAGALRTIPLQNLILELPIFTVFADANSVANLGAEHASPIPIFSILGWIYMLVVLLLVGRGLVGILRLAAFSKNGKRLPTEDATIVSSPNIPTAFSFFKTVFIPETPYSDDEKEMILNHERVHVKQKHSWDLMLIEVVCAVQFFNPFVWLLKREMRMNHEYLADRSVLKNCDSEKYFTLLMRKVFEKQPILVHSFHYSPIKHRIMMQITKPAKLLSQARYLAFIPVVLVLTFLFACQEKLHLLEEILPPENIEMSDVSELDTSDIIEETKTPANIEQKLPEDPIFQVVEDSPEFPGGENARMKYLSGNIRFPAEARENGIQGTVYVTFVVECDGSISNVKVVRGIGGGCDEETVRVVENMPKWIPGKQRGQAVRTQFMMPIRFTLADTKQPTEEPVSSNLEGIVITGFNALTQPATNSSSDDVIFQVVEDNPEFPGGENARMKYLSENIKYPAEAKEKGIQGTVFATFVIRADGSLSDIKIVRGIGGGCDEETVRVIENMPKWIPGKQRGQAVSVQFMMPIRFTLSE